MDRPSSRFPRFSQLTVAERQECACRWAGMPADALSGLTWDVERSDKMIENVVASFPLPMGIAPNFLIDGRDYIVPMVTEEPSVVAACSNAARIIRQAGGFTTRAATPLMVGQIQVVDLPENDLEKAAASIASERDPLLLAADVDEILRGLGGGPRKVQTVAFPDTPGGAMMVVRITFDVRDCMGANVINTACEAVAPLVERITGGRANMCILSNYATERVASASCSIPEELLKTVDRTGSEVGRFIVQASALAEVDPYRAATHNKGIMNGMDAVCVATGNDWRALEAGAHAFACRSGRYAALATWRQEDGVLRGSLAVPTCVGTVGGSTRSHPVARTALDILGVTSGAQLSSVLVATGLAQNFAALRALVTDGIQRGHMRLARRADDAAERK